MAFDYENFGAGLLVGWVSAYLVYRSRGAISDVLSSGRQATSSAQNRATKSSDRRYIEDLINQAQTTHLAGDYVNLTDILIEPRFLHAPELAHPEEDVVHDVFRVVPRAHDHPFLHAPYNVEEMSINDLSAGDRHIALLGNPGSGRTTALLSIALWSLGQLHLKMPRDRVQERLEAEEAGLSKADRDIRVKQRLSIEQRAKERLAQEQGVSFDEAEKRAEQAQVALFNRLMPIYVHLADLDANPKEYGAEIDPAEPLVRAVQYRVGRVTASTIPRNLYKRLNQGQVLLLVDGFDDLPEAERDRKLAWLRAFMSQYSENFIIVAGPAIGFGPLTQTGLTPVFLRPWHNLDLSRSADHWAEAWPRFGRKRRMGKKPEDAIIARAKANNQALYPAELAVKLWANFADDVETGGFEGWLRAYVKRYLPKDLTSDAGMTQIAQAAALQLEQGFITEAGLVAMATGAALPPPPADLAAAEAEGEEDEKGKGKKVESADEAQKPTTAQGKLISTLEKSGLLIRHRGKRFQFRHPFIAAYLASLTLKTVSPEMLAKRAMQPEWNQALAYASMHTAVDEAVRARLRAPADVLQNQVLQVGRWLAYAPANVTWRGPLLKHLGNMLTAPAQYPLIRERAAAALIDTRDDDTLFVFRQAARSADLLVRRLACLALGAVGNPEAIRDLIPLVNDRSPEVKLAAGIGLGAIGTQDALEAMVDALTTGDERLRQAVAEMFVIIPEEGYPVLYDAIEDHEMMLRRAAVFGLRRIKTTWAIIAIYKAFLEDEQWYVRSAAQQAFQDMQQEHLKGPLNYPPIESLAWLATWAATKGETVPAGEGANQVLMRALLEGDPAVRKMAASTIGQLGLASNTRSLYNALRDRQEEVRAAAYFGLAELEQRIGEPLPAPV